MIFVQLILAHLLGDFIFQPDSWVKDKEQKKAKSQYLYFHILIHFALAMLFLWDFNNWWMAAVVAVSHFLIDLSKLEFQKPKNKKSWFITDQVLHIAVIFGIYAFSNPYFEFENIFTETNLKFLAGLIFVTIPSSIIVKLLISSWTPETPHQNTMQTESLENAGKYIGILERLLVFVFIYVNHWEGVGFMIAAKSVFRFSDLAQAKQRKLTEYVLIGTLLSFGIAVLTGIIIKI